jgi:hypothetical protein
MSHTTVPSDTDLKDAIVKIKEVNPSAGIAKVHHLVREHYPDWTVSEKRTRKILQGEGLIVPPAITENVENIYPASRVISGLDVSKWSNKIYVQKFGKKKGKGLCASEPIAEGELIWKEDPYVLAPEW